MNGNRKLITQRLYIVVAGLLDICSKVGHNIIGDPLAKHVCVQFLCVLAESKYELLLKV